MLFNQNTFEHGNGLLTARIVHRELKNSSETGGGIVRPGFQGLGTELKFRSQRYALTACQKQIGRRLFAINGLSDFTCVYGLLQADFYPPLLGGECRLQFSA